MLTGCSPQQPATYESGKYSTFHTINEQILQYNCYGYALGTTEFYRPGDLSGGQLSSDYDVYQVRDLTIADLENQGYKTKVVNGDYIPKDGETMIAMRTTTDGPKDYHYMLRMEDGSWTHKPGVTPILTFNGHPEDNPWTDETIGFYGDANQENLEVAEDMWYTPGNYVYDSEIVYVVYYK